jgi:hypothetical protein
VRRSSILALSFLFLGALLPAACTQNFGVFTATGGGGGTSSSSSSGGGTGGCTTASDCNDTNPCTDDTCNASTGKCAHAAVPDGLNGADTKGDCVVDRCVGGLPKTVNDDADVPVNTNVCVTVTCAAGKVTTTNQPDGMSCGAAPLVCESGACKGCMADGDCPDPGECKQKHCDASQVCTPASATAGATCTMGGIVCDGSGACVACVADGDCTGASDICDATHHCVTSCGDGSTNGKETDTDCGGPCLACGNGKDCKIGTDCANKVCKQMKCEPADCNDNVQNGDETDVDCGGACGNNCQVGDSCLGGGDCQTGHCVMNKCVTQCNDGAKDGNETDVDCGGSCPNNCADGKGCGSSNDCTSNYCNPSNKCSVPSCPDTFKNQGETDIDCGGPNCATKCANTKSCLLNGDCTSAYCNPSKKCGTPNCTDGFQNQDETDTDCGGAICTTKCLDGASCLIAGDCANGVCTGNLCYPAACGNGMVDGMETDVDCGGGTCVKCASTKACAVDNDCTSGHCIGSPKKCQ